MLDSAHLEGEEGLCQGEAHSGDALSGAAKNETVMNASQESVDWQYSLGADRFNGEQLSKSILGICHGQ